MCKPVFLFSAGWRSGSTMLQRVVTASGTVLIWGEAGGALDRLADAFACYEQMLGPGGRRFKHGFGGNGAQEYQDFLAASDNAEHQWVACMNSPLDSFRSAFTQFFERVYAKPASELGYPNWGVKEVQSDLDTARFLRMLYPDAKFVFLVRNPIACLTSIKRHDWMGHPQDRKALEYYANHWLRLASQFRRAKFGLVVTYEDLISGKKAQEELAAFLEIETLPRHFAEATHSDWKPANTESLSFLEKRRLLNIVGKEMKNFGYHP